MRIVAMKAAAGVLLLATLLPAGAQAASVCQRLNAELASAKVTIGNTQSARKYSKAITRQQREMRKVKGDMGRLGCSSGSVIVIGGPNARNCRMLESTMSRMQANLRTLEAKKQSLVSPSISRERRQAVLASLEANGCNGLRDASAEEQQRPIKISFSSVAEPEKTRAPGDAGSQSFAVATLGGSGESGNLRTMCVRTCDGGFFPISSNASSRDFGRDAQVCSMMCPGVSTQLFYHSVTSQESSQMVSTIDGTPYEEMPFAYRYKTAADSKSCSCNFSAYYREMLRRETGEALPKKKETYSSIAIVGELNRQDQLRSSLPANSGMKLTKDRAYDPNATNIRRIGPEFLPEETALDLTSPLGG